MMNALGLYVRYAAASIRMQMLYPGSFLLLAVGQFLNTTVVFLGIAALFARFGNLGGWTLAEISIFYGVVNIAFAITEATTRGFDLFGTDFVRTGEFDRLLLRPRSATLQLLGHELRLMRIGRFTQGALVLAFGLGALGVQLDARDALILLFAVAGGVALFAGLLILQATLAFWTVESLEIANTLTYGGVEASQYPLDVYQAWFRGFLTYVVPLACVTFFPVAYVLGKNVGLAAFAPAVGFGFLTFALFVWGFGVRHYRSTGA